MHRILTILAFASAAFITLQDINAFENRFTISVEPFNIYTNYKFLGITPSSVPQPDQVGWDKRQPNNTYPGDYFRSPKGASKIILQIDELNEISNTAKTFIDTAYFNDFVFENLRGFAYTLYEHTDVRGKDSVGKNTFRIVVDTFSRKEYHVRYAAGDTIFVISGWLGKFLSFYRAIPGDFKYAIDQFQNEVKKLSPVYVFTDKGNFRDESSNGGYFYEYIDRKNMIRIRNYFVTDYMIFDEKTKKLYNKQYNLMEITKFIDKEVIP